MPTCHPFRDNYVLEIPIFTAVGSKNYDVAHGHLEFDDYETVRSVSKVSHQLRSELGEAFWSDVHITSLLEDCDAPPVLLTFFGERPLVAQAVKFFSFEIHLENESSTIYQELIRICKFMTENVSLQLLELRLSISSELALRALYSKGEVDWMRAIRSIGAREFRFVHCGFTSYGHDDTSRFGRYISDIDLPPPDPDYYPSKEIILRNALPRLMKQYLLQVRVKCNNPTAAEEYVLQSRREEETQDALTDQPWFLDSARTIW